LNNNYDNIDQLKEQVTAIALEQRPTKQHVVKVKQPFTTMSIYVHNGLFQNVCLKIAVKVENMSIS